VPLTASLSYLPQMREAIRASVRRHHFDLVHFDTIGLARYMTAVAGLPVVMNHHNAESFMMLRRTGLERRRLWRQIYRLEGHALRRYEARICPRCADNFVVSRLDANLLSAVAPSAQFSVIPNGVDVDYFYRMAPVSNHRVVFAGRLDQYSNREGILYFTQEVWPRVRDSYPDAVLDILGGNPPTQLLELARRDSSVCVHGYVPDIRPFFESAALVVCPIRDGGGTRLKVLDSLAMGKPIVATTIGTEGIDVTDDRELLIADSAAAFLSQISRIFDDPALCGRLSHNARLLAESSYSWTRITGRLLDRYELATEIDRAAIR
jgi:glycosyltransferase involved in cell wall biosynthesis